MKLKAGAVHAGDRLSVTYAGKRGSWHVAEVHRSGRKPNDIVILYLDRVFRGERQKHSIERKINERVEVTERA
jgi:hypothetical protein